MNINELKIFNNLIKTLLNLEMEDYENWEKIVLSVIKNIITSSEILKDPEISRK